jgi:hypothetical protein
VQLGGQIERHALGALGLDHNLVLAEDRVFELADDPVGLAGVVVAADDHVARATVGAHGLGGEEVHHAALAAPAEPEHDRVGQVQFVAAAPFRRPGLLVAEDREVVAVGGLGPDDLIAQHVAVGADLVLGHHRPLRIAEQPRVDPGEMPEVGEVLHLPGRVALPAVGPGGHEHPVAVLQFRDLGQGPARLLQRDPDQPVPLLDRERPDPGLGRDRRRVFLLRDGHAPAVGPVAPAVVRADQLVALDPAQRQRRAAVHAQVRHRPRRATGPAPDHQRLPEQIGSQGPVPQLAAERDRMPARPLSGQIREQPR